MTEAIEYQEHMNCHFEIKGSIGFVWLKVNGTLKPEYLLKCERRKKNAYVAKNDDTGKKREPYQMNPILWIYCFQNLQTQDFSTIRTSMLKQDMEFRPFYIFGKYLVCNLKVPLMNSVITLCKL